MGACILCGKSAGLFYALHKDCFNKYDNSNNHISRILESGLGNKSAQNIAEQIWQHINEHSFTLEASRRTLNRSLEHFSKYTIEKSHLQNFDISAWLELLDCLSLEESLFINTNFIVQQQNLPAVLALSNNSFPESNSNPANFSIELNPDEQLWWCFDGAYLEQILTTNSERQWSVVMQIVENFRIRKKQKNATKVEKSDKGKLLLTNQRIYFENGRECISASHEDIFSCTPIAGGVKIQTSESKALPQNYICEDGRLLFLFLSKAKELKGRR